MVGFVMRFTESARTSPAARKPNSTPWMADEVGRWLFIVSAVNCLRLASGTVCAQLRGTEIEAAATASRARKLAGTNFFGRAEDLPDALMRFARHGQRLQRPLLSSTTTNHHTLAPSDAHRLQCSRDTTVCGLARQVRSDAPKPVV